MTSGIRVLIADDHATLRKGIRAPVGTEPGIEVVGETADGLETVARAAALYFRKEGLASLDDVPADMG